MVVSWFQNGNSQFLGDFFVPSNPFQYLSRFSQSWDPNLDFGIFSLFSLFPTPRIILVAFYSGIFVVTGSSVAVELFLVLTILLLAYFGMRYLWMVIMQAPGTSLGQAIAGLFFVVNPFVTLYIENPVEIIAYAMIPWCLGFTLMGLRGFGMLKYSVLVSACLTISLITFPQVAISIIIVTGMVAIFAGHFLRKPLTRMKQAAFMISSFLATVGLNAYWLSLALTKTSLFFENYGKVLPSSPSLNMQNTIFATSRLLGDWSLLAGYAGRLYLPYSPTYYSDSLTVISTSAIPILAFAIVILGPFNKRNITIAVASLLGIILATGTNPPLGFAYGLFLSIPGSSLFRNPPRYFLSVVALGYSILLGVFVNFFVLKSRASSSVHRVSSLGVILLVVLAIAFASSPMISGEITRNWYDPSMKGYQVPSYYSEASNWMSSNNSAGRIFMLPHTGIYMATLWGYQGGNVYPYLFANPIITSSGGQYSSSSASDLINSVYDEFYANHTTYLGKVLSLLGVSYVILDRSVDTQFYNLPPPQTTLSLLGNQADIEPVGVFGDLILYRNTEHVSVFNGAYGISMIDGSPTNPASVVSVDDFRNGWQLGPSFSDGVFPANGSLTFESQHLVVTLPANGQYVFAELYKNVDFAPGVKYLIVDAHTTNPASIALTLNTLRGEVPMYAENPSDETQLNHYQLTNQSYLVYRIDGVSSNVTRIRFAISDELDKSYSGTLAAEFSTLFFANQIGDLSDMIGFVQQSSFDPAVNAVTLPTFLDPPLINILSTMNSSTSQSPDLTVREIDSTSVTIEARASHPFVLAYLTSFDESFTAQVDGSPPALHFHVDGFANGWLIENTGVFTIQIGFATQRAFLIGIAITFATIGLIVGLFLFDTSARSTVRSVLIKRWRKALGG